MKKLKVFSILIVCLAFTLMTLSLVFASCDSGGGTTTTYYTVTFDANGGSGTVPNNPSSVAAGSSITLPGGSGLTKTGYTFDGWNTRADGTGVTYSAGVPYPPTGDITLYAIWYDATATYTVTFNLNGGSGTVNPLTAAAGSSITLPGGSGLTKTGYTFGGWNTNTSGTGLTYSAGTSYTPTGNITLYAIWYDAAATYTVTFNANGGGGTVPGSLTAAAGSSITLPGGSGLSRNGYTFGGWNTDASGTGFNYAGGSSYTPSGNITLYANWTVGGTTDTTPVANDFTITGTGNFTYDGNAKTVNITPKSGKSPGDITILYDGEATPPVNAGTYTVTFNVAAAEGWNAANGLQAGTIIINKANGAAVSAPTLNGTPTHNSITINSVDPPGTGQSVEYGINTSSYIYPPTWQTELIFSGLSAGTTYYIFARTVENTNYGTGAASNSLTVTTLQTIPPDRIEYYWVDQHGNLATTSDGATSIGAGKTLAITAQAYGYTVKHWHLNGDNTGQSGNTYNFSSTAIGNHTVGLFVEKDGKLYNTNITITVVVPYTVTFDINSGSGPVPDPQLVTPGTGITLPGGSGLTKTSYTFGGWNTEPNGTDETNYSAGSSYTPPGDITLYARWYAGGTEANPFVLTENTWADGIITSTASDSAVWFSINVIVSAGRAYRVWWNDSKNGNDTKTLDVKVTIPGSDWFTDIDSGWPNGQGFSYSSGDGSMHTIKFKVTPYTSGSTGTFSIAYSAGSTRP